MCIFCRSLRLSFCLFFFDIRRILITLWYLQTLSGIIFGRYAQNRNLNHRLHNIGIISIILFEPQPADVHQPCTNWCSNNDIRILITPLSSLWYLQNLFIMFWSATSKVEVPNLMRDNIFLHFKSWMFCYKHLLLKSTHPFTNKKYRNKLKFTRCFRDKACNKLSLNSF